MSGCLLNTLVISLFILAFYVLITELAGRWRRDNNGSQPTGSSKRHKAIETDHKYVVLTGSVKLVFNKIVSDKIEIYANMLCNSIPNQFKYK